MSHIELSGQFIAIVKSVISDIDECATGKDKCRVPIVSALNGSYHCICKPGYYGDPFGK